MEAGSLKVCQVYKMGIGREGGREGRREGGREGGRKGGREREGGWEEDV